MNNMTLEQQVTSLELSKKLKDLGVKQESLFWWGKKMGFTKIEILHKGNSGGIECAAFTVAELGEMLPLSTKFYRSVDQIGKWVCWCQGLDIIREDTMVNAAAKMLVYLLENNLIKLP